MSAATVAALAVLLGGGIGLGCWMLLMVLPRWAAPSLTRRIAPYVRDVIDPAGRGVWGDATIDPGAAVARGIRSTWSQLSDRVMRIVGGSETVRRRLELAGDPPDVGAYRSRQILATAGVAACSALIAAALALSGTTHAALAVLPVVLPLATWMLFDLRLTSRAKARTVRIEEEVPTVLEFLALCLSAGEPIFDSIARVSRGSQGELAHELQRAVLETRTGSPLPESMTHLARRVNVASLTRAIDHLVAGMERGAPLASILQDQAADAREQSKRSLIELAGRKEIFMLIPLVFGLLPLSVLFAVFPGIAMLRLGVG